MQLVGLMHHISRYRTVIKEKPTTKRIKAHSHPIILLNYHEGIQKPSFFWKLCSLMVVKLTIFETVFVFKHLIMFRIF